MRIEDVQELEGWLTFPKAAVRLKVRRQRVNQLLEEDKLGPKEVRRVVGTGTRPAALLISEKAIERLLGEQAAAEAKRVAAETARAERPPLSASAA